MKVIHTLSLALVAILIFGCKSTPSAKRAPNFGSRVTFVVSCSQPSMGFTGTIVADGHTNRVSGTGGGTFQATGYDIVACFQKTGADGRMSLHASEPGGNGNSASTDKEFGGIRSEFHGQPISAHGATTF